MFKREISVLCSALCYLNVEYQKSLVFLRKESVLIRHHDSTDHK